MPGHPWTRLIETWFGETLVDPGAVPGRIPWWFGPDEARDIIARFGRFPHRNAVLQRENTAEEAEYLAGGAPSFGQ